MSSHPANQISPQPYDPSPQALRDLMDSYRPQIWKKPRPLPKTAAAERAVAAGVMFPEPWILSHDDLVDRVRRAAAAVSLDEVGQAFLASLTSRRLDLRSALGSYAMARFLPSHEFQERSSGMCRICAQYPGDRTHDVNAMSIGRLKYGGTHHGDIAYLAFDLEQFTRAPKLAPTSADLDLGRRLVEVLRTSAARTTSTNVLPALRIVPGNRDERAMLVDILGVCGILETPDHRGYAQRYIPADQREDPDRHHVDRAYPVCWWTGAHGVNNDNLAMFLPQLAA